MTSIAIRPLAPDQWRAFRGIRLEALQTEPGVFSMSYAEEVERPEADWREIIASANHKVFGLFDEARLIGITAVFRDRDDPSGDTALFAMSYIEPDYRGRGLSERFYTARLAWVRAHGGFKRVHVSHRASNEASRRANQRHGFVRTRAESKRWPDGSTEDNVHYELML
jgi:RimJ/RimL family protein N-acetyltransferase